MGGTPNNNAPSIQGWAIKVEEATAPITAPDTGRLELAEANSRTVPGDIGSNAFEMIRSLREARGTAGEKTDTGGLDEFGGGY